MVDYRKFSFLLRIAFQILVLKYMFKTESSELVFSTTIIIFINYLNLVLDLGLSLDQLSIKYGVRRLILGIKYVSFISILFIIPASIYFDLPLYVSTFIAISALFRNYYIKKQFVDKLFFLDLYGTIIALIIISISKYLMPFNIEYHYLVFLPPILEFILLIPIFLKLLFSKVKFRILFSSQNYISKILDITINNTDTMLVTLLFDNNISKNYIHVKTIFVKGCQISNLLILRVLYDKIEIMKNSKYIKLLFLSSLIICFFEFYYLGSIYLTSCIFSFILSLVTSYLLKHSNLKYYNIYNIIFYSIFYLTLFLFHLSPSLTFMATVTAIITTQIYGIRKI